MKKILSLIIALSLISALTKAKAVTNEYEKIVKSDLAGVILYARKMDGLYTDFKIDFQGGILLKPYWINTISPTWIPEIIYEDINRDGKKELAIILTKATGTGVLQREAHVFHIQQQKCDKTAQIVPPVEVLVEDPIAIVLKNVKTELTPKKANIGIGDKIYTIDIIAYGIHPKLLFEDIYFGNIINFEIKNNQLVAKIGGQISPAGGHIGDIEIRYTFKDKMYQAKTIEFKPSK